MDQDFKQMQSLVKKIDDSTKDIHRTINRIQTGDAQVCACSCHNAEVGPKIADEVQDLNVRLGYLEKLVGELLERDRDVGIDQNRAISTYNATDEYKCSRHDARDGRNLKPRVTSRERSRDAGIQTRRERSRDAGIQTRRDRSRDAGERSRDAGIQTRRDRDAGIQTRRDRSRDAGIQTVSSTSDTDNDHVISSDEEDAEETQVLASGVDKLQARVTQTKSMRQQSASRDTERTARPSAAQRGPEPKELSKTVPKDNRGSTQVETSWQTMRGGSIARPNVAPSVESKAPPLPTRTGTPRPVETVGSVSDRGGNAGVDIKPGTGAVVPAKLIVEGATSRPETEDANFEVEVIHQEETRMFARGLEWTSLAQMEVDSGKATSLLSLEGAHTAICLDISESMVRGNAWRQAKTFLLNYINELTAVSREHKVTDEYVSLVTFGHETRVVKRMTNKYGELLKAIESVKLGGPSPMYGGLYMALASLLQCDKLTTTVNGFPVYSKIVLISDGIVTETRQQAGPDIMDAKDEYSTDLMTVLTDFVKRSIDMYCVPVGAANMSVMETMAAGGGRVWSYEEGAKLGRRYFLTKAAGPGIFRDFLFGAKFDPNFKSELKLSPSDRLYMLEIVQEANGRRMAEAARVREIEDMFADTNNPNLPVVGSRVRRGPDWEEGWEGDKKGPGTVIGHMRWRDKVWVDWDDGDNIYQYRFGEDNCYDVFPTDAAADVRQPDADGSLNVGCVVKPNALTTVTNPDIQTSDRGVVTNILDSAQVGVRWSSGKKSLHENQGVDFCGPSETPAQVVQTKQLENKPSRQKNKNKK